MTDFIIWRLYRIGKQLGLARAFPAPIHKEFTFIKAHTKILDFLAPLESCALTFKA